MELDLVSRKEALSVENKDNVIGQWENLLRKWADEKTEKLKELALSDTCCRQVDNDEDDGLVRQTSDEYESIREADDHEELTKRTREVLQRHRGEAPIARFCELAPYHDGVAIRSGKRGNRPLPQEPPYPPPKKFRMGPTAKHSRSMQRRDMQSWMTRESSWRWRSESCATPSQLSCKETFKCGRSVSQLVQDLLDRKVSLFAPFLRLTVLETMDERPVNLSWDASTIYRI